MTRVKITGLEIELDGDASACRRVVAGTIEMIFGLASNAAAVMEAERAEVPASARALPPATLQPPEASGREITEAAPALPTTPVRPMPAVETARTEGTPAPPTPRKRGSARTDGPGSRGGRKVVCDEHPGREFTLEEAAALAKVKSSSLGAAVSPFGQRLNGGRSGGLHFHWSGERQPPQRASVPIRDTAAATQSEDEDRADDEAEGPDGAGDAGGDDDPAEGLGDGSDEPVAAPAAPPQVHAGARRRFEGVEAAPINPYGVGGAFPRQANDPTPTIASVLDRKPRGDAAEEQREERAGRPVPRNPDSKFHKGDRVRVNGKAVNHVGRGGVVAHEPVGRGPHVSVKLDGLGMPRQIRSEWLDAEPASLSAAEGGAEASAGPAGFRPARAFAG